MDALSALAASVAAGDLPRTRTVVPAVLDDATFDRLLERAAQERTTGALDDAIRAGRILASEEQYARALVRHEEALGLDLVLERLLADTSTAFADAAIPHRALKGPALAHLSYPDPAMRSFGDVDVLVRGDRFDDAVSLLTSTGGTARYREPRRNFTARFGKGVCVVTDRGFELDLHRVFVAGPFGLAIDTEDLFAEPDAIRLGDASVPVPSARVRFLHACYHVALTSPRLTASRDVAQMAWAPDLDQGAVLALAARWRGRAVVQRAVATTAERLGVRFPDAWADWADRYAPDRFESSALGAYVPGARSYAAQMATGVWAIRGVRLRLAYGAALLVPDRDYLGERDGSYVRRWQRAIVLARTRGRA